MNSQNVNESISPEMLELLKRLSREVDRYSIFLFQIEISVLNLLESQNAQEKPESLNALQKIDYLNQTSVSISRILTAISNCPSQSIDCALKGVKPYDLTCRLKDIDLEDVDNTKSSFNFFNEN